MVSRPSILMALALGAFTFGPSRAQPIPPGTCDLPAAAAPATPPTLPHVADALRGTGPLDVLAVGSGTMANPRLKPDEAFPARTAQALRVARPGLDVRVTVEARRGATAVDMLATLRKALAAHSYQLVLWQTGSVERLRASPPADLARTLADGVKQTEAAGADLVLIDPQYAAELPTPTDPAPYQAAFASVAGQPDVALLSRYALMQDWARAGTLDLVHVKRADRHRTLVLLHACLGRALGAAILDGAGTSPAGG